MFTSFLFEKLSHLNQFYTTETEFIEHLMSGEVKVSIPDIIKLQQQYETKKDAEKPALPCSHQEGDFVSVTFFEAGLIENCKVNGVYFKQGHIYYDLAVMTHEDDDGQKNYQRLYRIPQGLLNNKR